MFDLRSDVLLPTKHKLLPLEKQHHWSHPELVCKKVVLGLTMPLLNKFIKGAMFPGETLSMCQVY